jgi:conjugative relaxase-like TrwC/TraI family protein
MVNISGALNSQKVQAYHKTDYANTEQKSYYNQDGQVAGQWHGKLAEEMGLSGSVSAEEFSRLAEGQDPQTGEQLVRHRHATEEAVGHRAGWDATFSAPKSVSVTALVGGDERIIEAHREAVKKGLDYLERHVDARIGGNNPPEHTGKWVAATFEHDTSRPVNGYSAPQLHTHAVFFNITKTEDGSSHALDPRHIFEAQKTATAIYQSELGYRLRQLGYELEEGKGGAREIAGYSDEYLKANSSRSEQIEALAKQLQEQGLNKAEARQRAAHSTREAKGHQLPAQTRDHQRDLARRFGNQHEAIMANARAAELRVRQSMSPDESQKAALAAVTFSREKNFEREAVVSEHDILREALRRGQDLTTPDQIETAVRAQQHRGELLPMQSKGNQPSYTTPEMVAMESQNIRLMKDGQNQHRAFIPDSETLRNRIDGHFAQFQTDAANQTDPTRRQQLEAAIQNQKEAIQQVLTSEDKVQALQGAAGTGKTTSLTVVRKELEKEGYSVKGFAPTSRAAQQLADCGAECSTLQMHLTKPPEPNQRPTVYFLDETSLASAKQVNELLTRLGANDRVVLIGDVRQHEAVEAGRAFAQLQEHGIRTARLDEIVRQKDPSLRQAVEHLAAGRLPEAVDMLKTQGRVSQVSAEEDRFNAISVEYLKDREGTLVVSPDNRSRAAINAVVHQQLKKDGILQQQDHTIPVLVNRQDLTGADRKWAKSYELDNVVRYNKGSEKLGIKQGDYATITDIDRKQNLLTVTTRAGQQISYNPNRLHGVSVYRQEQRTFAVGERIQFTAPFKDKKVANRQLATVMGIEGKTLSVKLDSGKKVSFTTDEHANLDYGYAVTSHSSQGLTTNRVLINIDTDRTNSQLINDRLAYVAVSRARHDAHIYTNDTGKLAQALSRDVSKSSAIRVDNSQSQHQVHRQAPNTQAQGPTVQQAPSLNGHAPQPGQAATPAHGNAAGVPGTAQSPSQLAPKGNGHSVPQTLTQKPAGPAHQQSAPIQHDPTNPTQQPPAPGQSQGLGIEQSKGQAQQNEYSEEEGFGF